MEKLREVKEEVEDDVQIELESYCNYPELMEECSEFKSEEEENQVEVDEDEEEVKPPLALFLLPHEENNDHKDVDKNKKQSQDYGVANVSLVYNKEEEILSTGNSKHGVMAEVDERLNEHLHKKRCSMQKQPHSSCMRKHSLENPFHRRECMKSFSRKENGTTCQARGCPGDRNNEDPVLGNSRTQNSLNEISGRNKTRRKVNFKSSEDKKFNQAFQLLVQATQNTQEDECDVYGKLIAHRLRNFNNLDRQTLVHEIEGIVLQKEIELSSPPYQNSMPNMNEIQVLLILEENDNTACASTV